MPCPEKFWGRTTLKPSRTFIFILNELEEIRKDRNLQQGWRNDQDGQHQAYRVGARRFNAYQLTPRHAKLLLVDMTLLPYLISNESKQFLLSQRCSEILSEIDGYRAL
jgi:hypothetical protein